MWIEIARKIIVDLIGRLFSKILDQLFGEHHELGREKFGNSIGAYFEEPPKPTIQDNVAVEMWTDETKVNGNTG